MEGLWEQVLAASLVLLAFLAVLGTVASVLAFRRTRRRRAELERLHRGLRPGREVLFAGGLYGTLREVGPERVRVALARGVVVEASRYAVQALVAEGDPAESRAGAEERP